MIGKPAGTLEHVALVVGSVLQFVLGGDRLRLGGREAGSARIREIAKRDQLQAVTDPSRRRDRL